MARRDVRVSEAAISALPTRFWRDRRGTVAVAVAVLLPVLIGFAGLGVEVGMWFWIQRQNQSAADAAAISAALEYAAQIESGVTTNPAAAATTTANYNLFGTSPPNTLTLYPCYGYAAGQTCNTSSGNGTFNAVQVTLSQPLITGFADFVTAIWGPNVNPVTVTTTAIAAFPAAGTVCLLASDPTAADAVLVDNSATVSNPNCWVASNSTSGSALNCNGCTIAGPTNVVGGDAVSNGGQLSGSPNRTYASAIADPYAGTLTHTFLTAGMPTAPCVPTVTGPPGAPIYTYPANCVISGGPSHPFPINVTINLLSGTQIANGLWFTGNGTINLSPGTYWITDGDLTNGVAGNITLGCTGCSPAGLGVTMIFTTTLGSAGTIGTLSETGNVTSTLNAPSSGLLMVQDTVSGAQYNPGTIGSAASLSSLSGLIYFPNTNLSFAGNIQTDASNCLVAVARSVSLTGNIGLNDSGCQTAGLTTVPTILSVFLAV